MIYFDFRVDSLQRIMLDGHTEDERPQKLKNLLLTLYPNVLKHCPEAPESVWSLESNS